MLSQRVCPTVSDDVSRQVQRERLHSDGLPSPTEDWPPENQPPSPNATTW